MHNAQLSFPLYFPCITHHKYGVDILTLETTQEKDLSFVVVFFPSCLWATLAGFPFGFRGKTP